LTAYDPDAPTGSGFWHWVVFNIPASVNKLDGGVKADALPAGTVQARSDYGSIGFGGACPPPGKPHRYIFTVYALKVDKLDLDANATPAVVGFMTNANAIGKATLTAKYGR
jgi:Raf kinase inhibitor-like YbhB/YbcL family protein